jgi:hypothetical protein
MEGVGSGIDNPPHDGENGYCSYAADVFLVVEPL